MVIMVKKSSPSESTGSSISFAFPDAQGYEGDLQDPQDLLRPHCKTVEFEDSGDDLSASDGGSIASSVYEDPSSPDELIELVITLMSNHCRVLFCHRGTGVERVCR